MTQGTFVRFDKDTLKFEGPIERGTYAKYLEAIDGEVKGNHDYQFIQAVTLMIGVARVGLDMAKRNNRCYIVDGVAPGPAPANYSFQRGARARQSAVFVGFFTAMPVRSRRIER